MRLIVTGGMGFIGSNFIRFLLQARDWEVINLDKLTYAGNPENLRDVAHAHGGHRYWFLHGDVAKAELVDHLMGGRYALDHDTAARWHPAPPSDKVKPEVVVHFAAESHVDRSIHDPDPFIETNVRGTQVLLDAARRYGLSLLLYVSTDEVYGPAPPSGAFGEDAPLRPTSPYAASKAAADLMCLSYHRTYGLPVIISRCSNNYGPYQYPEKFTPLAITNAFEGKPIPIYGDGQQVRDWLYVEDHCEALDRLIVRGVPGEIYNVGGGHTITNLELARHILRLVGGSEGLLRHVADRPSHDRRYALRVDKLVNTLGWRPRWSFPDALARTVEWYRANETWWRSLKTAERHEYSLGWYGKA